MYSNIFYFRKINAIGGTEQFLYEIAKKYNKNDITVIYDEGNPKQIKRLSQLVRCIKRKPGVIYKCKKAFLNFNIEILNQLESTENYYAFVFHANFEELEGYEPPIQNPKLNHFIAVSKFAAEKGNEWLEKAGREERCEVCYNPLQLEKPKKVVRLLSACRLDDKVKGGERTQRLLDALDRYAEEHDRQYIWTIFTNIKRVISAYEQYDMKDLIKSKNVVLLEPRIDIRSYIADSDIILQLSNDMETYCYTINEALGYGKTIVTTPLSILKELPITDNEHIVLNWDCSNVDEVAKEIFEKKVKPFTYEPPEDTWDNLLVKSKSTYKNNNIKVQCIVQSDTHKYYDDELKRDVYNGEIYEIPEWRADYLEGVGVIVRL